MIFLGAQVAGGGGITDIRHGMSTEQVFELLGEPTGHMAMGRQVIFLFADGEVELRDGKVIGVKLREGRDTPQADTAALGAGTRRSPDRDLRPIMARLRAGKGLDCAEAIRLCDGPWAADAVPLLVGLLDNEEAFGLYTTRYIHGRPAGGPQNPIPTDMRSLAAQALVNIGEASWEPCVRVLRAGSPLARAKAASVLNTLQARHEPPGAGFDDLLLTVFDSRALDGPDASKARIEMARIIAAKPGPEPLAALHRMIEKPRNLPVEQTAHLLGVRKDPASIPLLVDVLLNHRSGSARDAAGQALARWGGEHEIANAVRSGAGDSDPAVRRHVMQLLLASGQSALTADYVRFFRDTDFSIRRHAIQGASRFRTPEMMLALARILQDESHETLARDAGGSLVLMTKNVHDARLVEALCEGSRHRDPERRKLFVDALRRTGAATGYEDLAHVARHDEDPAIRSLALEGLDNFESETRREVLLWALANDPSPVARRGAMQRVKYGSLRNDREDILLDLVQTGATEQALEAALVMGEFKLIHRHPDVLEVLIQALRHQDGDVRSKAVHYLCLEAGVNQYRREGQALGEDPEKWRAQFGLR